MNVAFIGLGRMGRAMAANLARAGLPLLLQNRSEAVATELAAELGATAVATPREAAGADVVITMLADADALFAVLDGPDGVLAGLRPGSVLVDMGTSGPDAVGRIAPLVAERGAVLIDAPVSGSVATAEAGDLALMIGGPEDVVARIRPVLSAVGRSLHHLGPSGAGATAKLAVNNIIFALSQSVAESLVLAERAGLDPAAFYAVLEESAVSAPMVRYRRDNFLDPDGTAVTLTMELARKDLRLIAELAERTGSPMPQSALSLATIEDSIAAGLDGRDMADVAVHLRRSAEHG